MLSYSPLTVARESRIHSAFTSTSRNESKINTEVLSAGRLIIAADVLDSSVLSNDSTLSEYKAQQSCERGFGFLKDLLFFADSIFLKSPERIESLANSSTGSYVVIRGVESK